MNNKPHDESQPRRPEDPATTHARLSAAAFATHLNACAAADAFLRGGVANLEERPDLRLGTTPKGDREAVIDPETSDERRFDTVDALRDYARTEVAVALTVRREGWTVPDPKRPRIEPDSARLLLHGGNPVVDVVAAVAMDGSLDEPHLRHNDAEDRMRTFDHEAHELPNDGIRYLASLFEVPVPRA